eukprot:CAMPEP_0177498598 /NCGR_PEP_ID=MMETSP0369-20130122/35667_1 /TAXON_ID=447022 ORGANISM="Scrippsiella hangoei-like, Strain SHHI-4" /NCGR_SAMPLE_ID=MMETSP0369 /ASSEMBLY_ACC=CAM_ASM_000364 /LENGTH=584 /DNA_ID=CAMNT_0018975829 /DNA_START=56 /DNA_END=1810 /DNA_ORIENTATION=-
MSAYWFLRAFFENCVIKVFFRRVDVVGLFRIPDSGPVIFIANHNNQFVDPMMLIVNINRVVRFLIAAKSLGRPMVGTFARMAQAIGVERPQDLAKKGKGIVSCDECSTAAVGEGTEFTKELHVGAKIKVGDTELGVKSIESDTQCTVEKCPMAISSAPYKVLPRVDQALMYSTVHTALKAGDCIGIFPEGGSHDRATLLDLKPGVAIMALGAMQAGAGSVKIVPCGLNYFDPYRFRSRVIVEFGDPFEVPAALAEQYATDKRGAVAGLMKLVDDAMKGVMPGAQDYEEQQALLTMRALYKPRNKRLSPEETLKLNKMFAMARIHMGKDERFESLMTEVIEYVELLRSASLRDRDVRMGLARDKSMAWRTVSALLQLLLLLPLTVPTAVLGLPVAAVTAALAKREKKQALAGSSVKVKALDVVASYKIIVGLVVLPLYAFLLAAVATGWFHLSALGFFLTLFIFIPVFFGNGIRSCDHSVRCLLRCRATMLFWGCSSTAGLLQKLLIDRREKLQEKVQRFVEDAKLLITEEALKAESDLQAKEISGKIDLLQREGVVPAAAGSSLSAPLLDKSLGQEASSGCVIA